MCIRALVSIIDHDFGKSESRWKSQVVISVRHAKSLSYQNDNGVTHVAVCVPMRENKRLRFAAFLNAGVASNVCVGTVLCVYRKQ